jgi:hypothetical protein
MLSATPEPPAAPVDPAADVGLTDQGFVLGARTIAWADIERIRTYKLDFDTIDCVCLSFELGAGDAVEVTEESNGFNDFTDEMLERFPAIDRDWYTTVMTPAFQRNEAILFDKATSQRAATSSTL